jgi:hypothetical protein
MSGRSKYNAEYQMMTSLRAEVTKKARNILIDTNEKISVPNNRYFIVYSSTVLHEHTSVIFTAPLNKSY